MKINGVYARSNENGCIEIFVRVERSHKVLKITDQPIDPGDSAFVNLTRVSHFEIADSDIQREINSIDGSIPKDYDRDQQIFPFPKQR